MKKSGNLPNQIQFDGATHQEKMLQNAIDRVRMVHEAIKGEPIYGCFSDGQEVMDEWEETA